MQHDHVHIGDQNITPYGNGVLLWFELDDFDAAVARAEDLKADVVMPAIAILPTATAVRTIGKSGRDPEGYTVVLASPDGSADGNWKP